MSKKRELRVWWCPQVPCKPFLVGVDTVDEGARIMDILAEYDIFQFENRIKPDYTNMGGMEEFIDGLWEDVDQEEIDESMDKLSA